MDKLLTTKQLGEILSCSPNIAASFASQHGLHPIDLGRGRGKGLRWLESDVTSLLAHLHETAQPKPKKRVRRSETPVTGMKASELYALLSASGPVQ